MSEQILPNEYGQFSSLLERYSGINLGKGKEYLVKSRMKPLLQEHRLDSYGSLIRQFESNISMRHAIVDAMTTNETLWFRDDYPYKILRERLLPELAEKNASVRIWSAASSTGQEPYSIGMECEDFTKRKGSRTKFEIVASDISQSVLDEAAKGIYPDRTVQRGMQDGHFRTYFDDLGDNQWQVKSTIRQKVQFKQQNLLDDFRALRTFDLIFCRNVLIYFSPENKINVIKRMHAQLKKGGYLMLGASESVYDLDDYFEVIPCNPGFVYRAK